MIRFTRGRKIIGEARKRRLSSTDTARVLYPKLYLEGYSLNKTPLLLFDCYLTTTEFFNSDVAYSDRDRVWSVQNVTDAVCSTYGMGSAADRDEEINC